MPNPPDLKTLYDLSGKTCFVTGGCRNFGLEISTGIAELGGNVIVTSRSLETADSTAKQLADAHGIQALGVQLELGDEASIIAAFDRAAEVFPKLDCLVNNAGGHGGHTPTGDLINESVACFEGYLKNNLTGVFLTMREYARRAGDDHNGSIVNIASISSLMGRDRRIYEGTECQPNPLPYTASKAGVIGITYDCAALLAPKGIRVNAVSPGGFERGHDPKFVAGYSNHAMLDRMGRDGWDLKGAVAFLLSDASAYITAHNLVVDGGFTRYH